MPDLVQIQAVFSGYANRACTVYSAYDRASGILIISAEGEYKSERRPGCVVLTNVPSVPRDSLFTEKDIRASIEAYYSLRNGLASDNRSTRLVFSDRAMRTNPDSAIDHDGMDERGTKYKVKDTITSAQMAVLATCLFASQADVIAATVGIAKELDEIQGLVISI